MREIPVAKPRPLPVGWPSPQRGLLLGVLLLAAIAVVGVGLAVVWPDSDDSAVFAGEVADFQTVSVTHLEEDHVFIVRLDDGSFLALYDTATGHLDDPIAWLPDFELQGITGWFRSPFHAETYDRYGKIHIGPAARGMDRFLLDISGGRVIVNTSIAYCGGEDRGGGTPCDATRRLDPVFAGD